MHLEMFLEMYVYNSTAVLWLIQDLSNTKATQTLGLLYLTQG